MDHSNQSRGLERKNADAGSGDLKQAIEGVMTAFSEFKQSNDQRLKEIEKKGSADPLLVAKLDKINEALNQFESFNQRLTLEEQGRKEMRKQLDDIELKAGRFGVTIGGDPDDAKKKDDEYKKAFGQYIRKSRDDVNHETFSKLNEFKALVAGNDSLGGYYLAPPDTQSSILKNVVEQSPMRSIVTVTSIGVQSLKLPKRTGTFAARRTTEVGTRSETTGYTTGLVEIHAPEMYAEVHISEQMLEDTLFDVEAELGAEFSEQFAVLEGQEFISGIGAANECEGILTNADVGVTNSGNATAVTADGFLNLYYDVKTAHSKEGIYILNRSTLKTARTLKDGMGQYLWVPGLANGIPNTINGALYVEMPDMPDQAANTFPVAFGNFRRAYRVVDRIMLSVLRDPFTQSGSGKIRFLARKRTGGGVVLAEAIRKLKCEA